MIDNSTLKKRANKAFEKKLPLLGLWQEIAENFYPQRADFLGQRSMDDEFADHLMDSYPVIAHRELTDIISVTLRNDRWFELYDPEEGDDRKAAEWMDSRTDMMRRKMQHKDTGFIKATKEADADWTAFGQCVLQPQWDWKNSRLLVQCHHLRDVAWEEDWNGEVITVYRKIKMSAQNVVNKWGQGSKNKGRVHRKVHDLVNQKNGDTEIDIIHFQIPSEQCGPEYRGTKYQSIYMDVSNDHIIEQVGVNRKLYVIPRWRTISGSAYGYSPAVVAALPDARVMQSMTWTLLQAGEKAVSPPMLATQGAIRGDINLMADSITIVDQDYDERLGEVLRPLTMDRNGIPFAMDMKGDTRGSIDRALYLSSMSLPVGENMTAYEVQQRMEEFVRKTKPLFDPVEPEYNGGLCEIIFDIYMEQGQLGPIEEIPDSLSNREVEFKFRSPIDEAEERGHGHLFNQAVDYAVRAMELDDTAPVRFDIDKALTDAISGSGAPQNWLLDDNQVNKLKDAIAQKKKQAEQIAMLEKAAQMENDAAQAND